MEELIKRLERVIQTGAPDKDGQHPISAEVVLEVVKGLYEHGTNLAEVGTDCISRQQAIDAVKSRKTAEQCKEGEVRNWTVDACVDMIRKLPSAQPEIVRCKDCKHWDGVDTCDVIDAPVWGNDFCSMAERRTDE